MIQHRRDDAHMASHSRRSFLRRSAGALGAVLGAGGLAAAGKTPRAWAAEAGNAESGVPPTKEADAAALLGRFPTLGRLQPVGSKQISASPLSVGFEVLDRRRFEPGKTYDHPPRLGVKWARCPRPAMSRPSQPCAGWCCAPCPCSTIRC